jgi:hypothetical protein
MPQMWSEILDCNTGSRLALIYTTFFVLDLVELDFAPEPRLGTIEKMCIMNQR